MSYTAIELADTAALESFDEIDFLTPTTPTLVGSGSATPALSDASTPLGRTLKLRVSNDAFATPRKAKMQPAARKRKLSASESRDNGDAGGHDAKKSRMEERKAVSARRVIATTRRLEDFSGYLTSKPSWSTTRRWPSRRRGGGGCTGTRACLRPCFRHPTRFLRISRPTSRQV